MKSENLFRIVILVSLLGLVSLVGCGEPTDDPEDCTENQFFDESKELCFTCPALEIPDCGSGCGFELVDDGRGCREAQCLAPSDCSRCPEQQFFSDRALSCQPCDGPDSCEDGRLIKTVSGDSCHTRCEPDN